MLLRSRPDMVHSLGLRKTHPSSQRQTAQSTQELTLGEEITPAYSGFQVQGTATAPASMTPSDTRKIIHAIQYTKFFSKKQYLLQKNQKIKIYFATKFAKRVIFLNHKTAAYVKHVTRDKSRLIRSKE